MAFTPKWMSPETLDFVKALQMMQGEEEMLRFLDDVCTIKEIQAISQRLHVAKLLNENKTYVDIEAATKASTATISRVNRSLAYGANGYQILFERQKDAK